MTVPKKATEQPRAPPRRRARHRNTPKALLAALCVIAASLAASAAPASADPVGGTVLVFAAPVTPVPAYTCFSLPFTAKNSDGTPFVGAVRASWSMNWWQPGNFGVTTDSNGNGSIDGCAGQSPGEGLMYAWADRANAGTYVAQDPTEIAGVTEVVVTPVDPALAGLYPSDTCPAAAAVYDGFASSDTYVKLRVQQVDPQNSWVCLRIDGPSISYGGKFFVNSATPGTQGAPYVDSNASACTTTAGNATPGSHPQFGGTLAGTVPYSVDTYSPNGDIGLFGAWVCVGAGAVQERVVIPGMAGGIPAVTFKPDAPGSHVGAIPRIGTKQSALCQVNGGRQVVDALVDDQRVYLYEWDQPSGARSICVRSDFLGAGGVLTVPAGAAPRVVIAGDAAGCTVPIIDNTSPPSARVFIATGAMPPSVCLTVNGSTSRVTVSGPGALQLPTWTQDT